MSHWVIQVKIMVTFSKKMTCLFCRYAIFVKWSVPKTVFWKMFWCENTRYKYIIYNLVHLNGIVYRLILCPPINFKLHLVASHSDNINNHWIWISVTKHPRKLCEEFHSVLLCATFTYTFTILSPNNVPVGFHFVTKLQITWHRSSKRKWTVRSRSQLMW